MFTGIAQLSWLGSGAELGPCAEQDGGCVGSSRGAEPGRRRLAELPSPAAGAAERRAAERAAGGGAGRGAGSAQPARQSVGAWPCGSPVLRALRAPCAIPPDGDIASSGQFSRPLLYPAARECS